MNNRQTTGKFIKCFVTESGSGNSGTEFLSSYVVEQNKLSPLETNGRKEATTAMPTPTTTTTIANLLYLCTIAAKLL